MERMQTERKQFRIVCDGIDKIRSRPRFTKILEMRKALK